MALISLTAEFDSMTDKDYSLDAFNKFFDFASSKGIIKRNTAQSRKAATNKILDILDKSERNDLRKIDIDQVFERFQNLSGMQYKQDSLQVYLSRARTALSDFISYVDNPSGFKSSSTQRSSRKGKKDDKAMGGTKNFTGKQRDTATNHEHPDDTPDVKHIIVPVPLRENLTVKISNLPADLTVGEAERLAAIVKAYAVPSTSTE